MGFDFDNKEDVYFFRNHTDKSQIGNDEAFDLPFDFKEKRRLIYQHQEVVHQSPNSFVILNPSITLEKDMYFSDGKTTRKVRVTAENQHLKLNEAFAQFLCENIDPAASLRSVRNEEIDEEYYKSGNRVLEFVRLQDEPGWIDKFINGERTAYSYTDRAEDFSVAIRCEISN